MTTEQFVSQAARSAIIAEQIGRAMLYMGAVSSALITFGFVAQAADLTPFIAAVLPALFLLGEFTFAAMVRNSMESVVLLRQIQRIRRYYRGLGPDARNLFDPPESDRQFDAAIATFGLHPAPLQLLFSGASTVAAVNATSAASESRCSACKSTWLSVLRWPSEYLSQPSSLALMCCTNNAVSRG
ncbi:MAG TPA: hypothetical protein VIX82_16640 [Solirubrobacteraceae bacterium]